MAQDSYFDQFPAVGTIPQVAPRQAPARAPSRPQGGFIPAPGAAEKTAQDAADKERQRLKDSFRMMSPEEVAAQGLPAGGVYQVNGLGEVKEVTAAPKTGDPKTAALNQLKTAGIDLFSNEDRVADLIMSSTSGRLETFGANLYGDVTGDSTDGMKAIGALRPIVSTLVLDKTGGSLGSQISDGDRKFIIEQMGNLADPEVPADQRLASWNEVKRRIAATLGVPLDQVNFKGEQTPATEQQAPFIPGVREPEMVRNIPKGTQVELGADQIGRDEISAGSNYLESIGIYPNDQAKITAFWNANKGNGGLTTEGVKQWYAANGYGQAMPDEAQIATAVEAAKAGNVDFTFDMSAMDEAYVDQLDAAIEEQGIDPESIGRSAAAGGSSGITLGWNDEIMGALSAADEALKNGDIIGAYEANRDIRRRIRERAMEENPGTTIGAEVLSSFAIPIAGSRNAVARGGQAAVRQAARTGAIAGGVAGAGYGEGVEGTIGGAAVGTGLGYVIGGQAEKALRGFRARRLNNSRGGPNPPTGGGGGSSAAQNIADAEKFGMQISPGDAGGRGLKVVERILDNQPGSASVMNESRNRLQGQMVEAVDNVASGFGSTTSFRGIGEAGQAGVRGWKDRLNTVADKAYNAIPIRAETSANIAGTVQKLDELTNKITSNPKLASMLQDKRLVGYLEALRGQTRQVNTGVLDASGSPVMRQVTEGGSLSWNDLKQLRSRIGEEIGEQVIGEGTLKSDLRGLYAALSRDMEATARQQGPGALKAFERANTLYKNGQERLERVWKSLLGPDGQRTPEAAAAVIQRISREGKSSGDLRLLGELRKTTAKTGEWDQISNGVIRLLGQPVNSEGREFAPKTFFQNYGDMSAEAKNLLFGGANKELRQNLDEFARVVGLVAKSDGTRNASNTGMTISGLAGLGVGGVPGLLGQALVSFGASKAWTNPKFVQWATGYTRMINGAARNGGTVNPAAHAKQMERLSRIAAAEPAIAADALGLQQQLLARFQPGQMPLAAEGQGENTAPRSPEGTRPQ